MGDNGNPRLGFNGTWYCFKMFLSTNTQKENNNRSCLSSFSKKFPQKQTISHLTSFKTAGKALPRHYYVNLLPLYLSTVQNCSSFWIKDWTCLWTSFSPIIGSSTDVLETAYILTFLTTGVSATIMQICKGTPAANLSWFSVLLFHLILRGRVVSAALRRWIFQNGLINIQLKLPLPPGTGNLYQMDLKQTKADV